MLCLNTGFVASSGKAPSRIPTGQKYLQNVGSPSPKELVTKSGKRMTKTINNMYFNFLNGLSIFSEIFFFLTGILKCKS